MGQKYETVGQDTSTIPQCGKVGWDSRIEQQDWPVGQEFKMEQQEPIVEWDGINISIKKSCTEDTTRSAYFSLLAIYF